MSAYLDRPSGAARAVSLLVVVLAHLAVIAFILAASGAVQSIIPALSPVLVLPSVSPPPPPPPPIEPKLTPPDLLPAPMPEIAVIPPAPSSRAPTAIVRVAPKGPSVSHFGAASGDAGLGVGLAVSGTGGARGRGGLGDFEAAVKRAILARKVQPFLAWDRRNTCVVNYTASVAPDGSLAGIQIDACAVREINDAARDAIRQAAPFQRPPNLGGRVYDVHGTLIFHP